MQTITKRLAPAAVATILTAAALLPGIANAEASKTVATTLASSPFCTNLSARAANQNSKLTSLQSSLSAAQTKHVSDLHGDWTTYGTKLAGLQSQWQNERNNEYAKLTALAKTDAQKQAVVTFQTTLNNAITTRESANATARATYQNAVLAAASTEASTVNSAAQTLQSAINSAVSTAEASCQAGTATASSLETTLKSAVTAAKQTYETTVRNARATYKSTVTSLHTTEVNTMQANDATFQAAVQSATTALKTAFGTSS